MGTGMDHSPGRTRSTGGMTSRSHASFWSTPVTTTIAGTVGRNTGADQPTSAPPRRRPAAPGAL